MIGAMSRKEDLDIIIKDYNERDYRTVWQKPKAVHEDRFESAIERQLLTKEPGWFIDIGGGYGRCYPLYKREGRKVVILDYAMNLLEIAAESFKNDSDVYFVAANAYRMPFKDGVFTGGISIRTFHHMNEPGTFLTECARVMKTGGRLLMEYANKRNLFRIAKRGKQSLTKDHEAYGDMLFGTHPAFFKTTAEEAGFVQEHVDGTGYFPRFINERTRVFMPFFSLLEHIFDTFTGHTAFAPLTFADLRKQGDNAETAEETTLADILACPACRGTLAESKDGLSCTACKSEFKRNGAIYDLRYTE